MTTANDSTATKAAAASSSQFATRSYSEYADGVAYRRLIAFALLSMAISGGDGCMVAIK